MRVETITRKIYTFEELSEIAKSNAIDNYRNNGYDNCNEQEIKESYNLATNLIYDKLEELREVSADFAQEFEQPSIKGVRLYKWIINNLSYVWKENKTYVKLEKDSKIYYISKNGIYSTFSKYAKKDNVKRESKIYKYNNLENCGLTGVCYDFDAMNSIIDFIKNPKEETTIYDLINDRYSLESLLNDNYDIMNSDEYIIDMIINNDYEFYENGEMI